MTKAMGGTGQCGHAGAARCVTPEEAAHAPGYTAAPGWLACVSWVLVHVGRRVKLGRDECVCAYQAAICIEGG